MGLIMIVACFLLPQPLHFFAEFQQLLQGAGGGDRPVLQDQDAVSPPQCRAAVRNDQAGSSLGGTKNKAGSATSMVLEKSTPEMRPRMITRTSS